MYGGRSPSVVSRAAGRRFVRHAVVPVYAAGIGCLAVAESTAAAVVERAVVVEHAATAAAGRAVTVVAGHDPVAAVEHAAAAVAAHVAVGFVAVRAAVVAVAVVDHA